MSVSWWGYVRYARRGCVAYIENHGGVFLCAGAGGRADLDGQRGVLLGRVGANLLAKHQAGKGKGDKRAVHDGGMWSDDLEQDGATDRGVNGVGTTDASHVDFSSRNPSSLYLPLNPRCEWYRHSSFLSRNCGSSGRGPEQGLGTNAPPSLAMRPRASNAHEMRQQGHNGVDGHLPCRNKMPFGSVLPCTKTMPHRGTVRDDLPVCRLPRRPPSPALSSKQRRPIVDHQTLRQPGPWRLRCIAALMKLANIGRLPTAGGNRPRRPVKLRSAFIWCA